MKKLEQLILASRRATENQEYTATAGIQDNEFIQYFNNGQEEIQTILNNLFPHINMATAIIPIVANQEAYDLPSDVFMSTRVDFVEYSQNGLPENYYALKKGSLKERLNGQQANPAFYIRLGNQLLLQPVPQATGSIRVTYQKAIPTLDIKRGQVLSSTIVGNTLTALTLDPAQILDADTLNEEGYLTITSPKGAVKAKSIPIIVVNPSTGLVTLDGTVTLSVGETISIGDTVCAGKYASQVSLLPDLCEKYLLEYANVRILIRDSSTDSAEVAQIIARIQSNLQTAFAEPDNDPDYVPILDAQYLGWDSY